MAADSDYTTDWISFVNCDFGYVITKCVSLDIISTITINKITRNLELDLNL